MTDGKTWWERVKGLKGVLCTKNEYIYIYISVYNSYEHVLIYGCPLLSPYKTADDCDIFIGWGGWKISAGVTNFPAFRGVTTEYISIVSNRYITINNIIPDGSQVDNYKVVPSDATNMNRF